MSSVILDSIEKLSSALKNRVVSTDANAEIRNLINQAILKLEQIEYNTGSDYLLLKWGGWKSWESDNQKIQALMKEHDELGLSASAMLQKESDRQKELLCQVIDLVNGTIQNDWDGNYYTKKQAKEYVMGYSN